MECKNPDENICEVYWPTGLKARQGFLVGIDLNDSEDLIISQVKDLVIKYGKEGFIDTQLLTKQNLN